MIKLHLILRGAWLHDMFFKHWGHNSKSWTTIWKVFHCAKRILSAVNSSYRVNSKTKDFFTKIICCIKCNYIYEFALKKGEDGTRSNFWKWTSPWLYLEGKKVNIMEIHISIKFYAIYSFCRELCRFCNSPYNNRSLSPFK